MKLSSTVLFQDEAYKSNVKDRNRLSEISQIQRERESQLVYQPKMFEKSKKTSVTEKATFKNHMFSQKDRERNVSTSSIPIQRKKFEDNDTDDFSSPSIPKPILASPTLKAPAGCLTYNSRVIRF